MQQRRGWTALVLTGVSLLAGCSLDESADSLEFPVSGDYELGGQTGSLVPDCGIAPRSADGLPVPAGDALAVVYARGCPEAALADQVVLRGPLGGSVPVSLEPLGQDTYLVRASDSVPEGEYQLELAGQPSRALAVGAALPQPGTPTFSLSIPAPDPATCSAEEIELTLALSPELLAVVPLTRWLLRVDGGAEQLWVDYGALELDPADNQQVRLVLPQCGFDSCLAVGSHRLVLRADVAGEPFVPEPVQVDIVVSCAGPGGDANLASSSCTIAARGPSPHNGAWLSLALLSFGRVLRRSRREVP